MTRNFSGRDVVKVLNAHGYRIESHTGSHVTLTTVTDGGEFRRVTAPLHSRLKTGTLRNIAEQAGANDFDEFCRWIDKYR